MGEWKLGLTSAKVKVEVEAELGKKTRLLFIVATNAKRQPER